MKINKCVQILKINIRATNIWLKKYPKLFVSTAIYSIYHAVIPYVYIYISAKIINELSGNRDPSALKKLVIIALMTTFILSLIDAGLMRWMNCAHACIKYDKEKIFIDKLLLMDFAAVDSPHTYDLLAQIHQNENFAGFGLAKVIDIYKRLLGDIMKIIGAVVLSVSLFTMRVINNAYGLKILNNPICAVLIIVIMALVTVFSPFLSNKAKSYWASIASKASMVNKMFDFYGFLAYNHDRALDIRIYRQDLICEDNYSQFNSFSPDGEVAKCARGYMGVMLALSVAVSHIFTGVVYLYVCLKAWAGAFGVGSAVQYIGAITSLSDGVSDILSVYGDMSSNAEFLKLTFEFLDIPSKMNNGARHIERGRIEKYEIEFRNVSFKYPNADGWALKDINFKLSEGQRVAVVGENGSGKTTFIKLLCRLYDPTSGEILLNDINIKELNYDEYINVLSVVFQDFRLLSFPIMCNVAASESANFILVEESLKKAGIFDRVSEMPEGIETYLYKEFDENGIDVSGGEAQKIAIARALYKKAPFLILDEPTASLDPIAESEIYKRLNEIAAGRTTVFISHRLSSCIFCDKIVAFDSGRIVQVGTHRELLEEAQGKYYTLWQAQAQYYDKKLVQ